MRRLFHFHKHRPQEETGCVVIGSSEVGYTVQRRKKRSRIIALYVDPPGKLRLVVPARTGEFTIQSILADRKDWIAGRLAELKKNPGLSAPEEFGTGSSIPYLGEIYNIQLTNDPKQPQTCSLSEKNLEVNLHKPSSDEKELRDEIRLEILLWYKKRANEILKSRSEYWAGKLNLKYRALTIGNPRRQWGSCSAKNDIRYNWRVILAPMSAIDYLVVHELAHITHKNHSQKFWRLVASAIPDFNAQRKLLRTMDASFTL